MRRERGKLRRRQDGHGTSPVAKNISGTDGTGRPSRLDDCPVRFPHLVKDPAMYISR